MTLVKLKVQLDAIKIIIFDVRIEGGLVGQQTEGCRCD